jgi:hypothetical protein
MAADVESSGNVDARIPVGMKIAQYLLPCATASLGISRILAPKALDRPLIPSLSDQNRWAQSRKPMDMIVQG